jgi:transcription initiation factor IIF auxiliary subunit
MQERIAIKQSEHYEGDDWWAWSVWIEGDDDALDQVEFVEWRLHPTFPNPVRRVTDRGTRFRLETGGWGVFPIVARVHMKDGSDTQLRHQLSLHYTDGSETTA